MKPHTDKSEDDEQKKGRVSNPPFALFAANRIPDLCAFALLQLFDQLRLDFEEVTDDDEVEINHGSSATTLPFFHT